MNHRIVQAGPGLHVGDYVLAQTIDRDRVISPMPKVIEGHRLQKVKVAGKTLLTGDELKKLANAPSCVQGVDVTNLKYCSEKYQISPDPNDYFFLPVPLVITSFPNRNLDAFPYDELTAWRTMVGQPAFATLKWVPAHQDHDNQVDERAKGVVIDAHMAPFRDQWHVHILKAIDRSKDYKLARRIEQTKGAGIGHSMGALVEKTECSICGYISDGVTTCDHIAGGSGKGRIIQGKLCYELLRDFNFVESSVISQEQASPTALSSGMLLL